MLKLISIHINKTAGTSFEEILRDNYSKVYRINSHDGDRNRRSNSCDGDKLFDYVPDDADVMHGHFKAYEVNIYNSIPIITWVRNPVDRVISNYFYDLKQKKIKPGLIDYAKEYKNQNRMSKMLFGIELDQLFFIGITEYFDRDIEILSYKLNWAYRYSYKLNTTSYQKIHKDIRLAIAYYNKVDVELYRQALIIREYDTKTGLDIV